MMRAAETSGEREATAETSGALSLAAGPGWEACNGVQPPEDAVSLRASAALEAAVIGGGVGPAGACVPSSTSSSTTGSSNISEEDVGGRGTDGAAPAAAAASAEACSIGSRQDAASSSPSTFEDAEEVLAAGPEADAAGHGPEQPTAGSSGGNERAEGTLSQLREPATDEVASETDSFGAFGEPLPAEATHAAAELAAAAAPGAAEVEAGSEAGSSGAFKEAAVPAAAPATAEVRDQAGSEADNFGAFEEPAPVAPEAEAESDDEGFGAFEDAAAGGRRDANAGATASSGGEAAEEGDGFGDFSEAELVPTSLPPAPPPPAPAAPGGAHAAAAPQGSEPSSAGLPSDGDLLRTSPAGFLAAARALLAVLVPSRRSKAAASSLSCAQPTLQPLESLGAPGGAARQHESGAATRPALQWRGSASEARFLARLSLAPVDSSAEQPAPAALPTRSMARVLSDSSIGGSPTHFQLVTNTRSSDASAVAAVQAAQLHQFSATAPAAEERSPTEIAVAAPAAVVQAPQPDWHVEPPPSASVEGRPAASTAQGGDAGFAAFGTAGLASATTQAGERGASAGGAGGFADFDSAVFEVPSATPAASAQGGADPFDPFLPLETLVAVPLGEPLPLQPAAGSGEGGAAGSGAWANPFAPAETESQSARPAGGARALGGAGAVLADPAEAAQPAAEQAWSDDDFADFEAAPAAGVVAAGAAVEAAVAGAGVVAAVADEDQEAGPPAVQPVEPVSKADAAVQSIVARMPDLSFML